MTEGLRAERVPVTIAVPNLDQGRFLDECLGSIWMQGIQTEVIVADGGSVDCSHEVILRHAGRLRTHWSGPDGGQANAINRAIEFGCGDYVGWLNADDVLLPGAIEALAAALDRCPESPFAFGRCLNRSESAGRERELPTRPFDRRSFARKCTICQPATLIRRSAWEAVGGLDERYQLAMDYDLWWRLSRLGPPAFVDRMLAVNRDHATTKTRNRPLRHCRESVGIVWRETRSVPVRWWAGFGVALVRQVRGAWDRKCRDLGGDVA